MADCKICKRTDTKCCTTCARNPRNCGVRHICGLDCDGYKPKTNADRIRSLSDEELAKVIMCPYDRDKRDCKESCWECCLKWLKSEVGCE